MSDGDMDVLRQVRKALDDIGESFAEIHTGKADYHKVEYQVFHLRKMIDEQPSRRNPWSAYRAMVEEEFDE